MDKVSDKGKALLSSLNLKLIKVLYNDYVFLCENEEGRKVVLKTDHMDKEVEIHNVVSKALMTGKYPDIKTPKFYAANETYILMEYLDGPTPRQDLKGRQLMDLPYIDLIADGYWEIMQLFSDSKKDLGDLVVKEKKWVYEDNVASWTEGLLLRKWPERSFNMSEPKGVPEEKVNRVVELSKKVKDQVLVPSYGVFGPHHLIRVGKQLGFFDFGGHLKWKPKTYDATWFPWGVYRHFSSSYADAQRNFEEVNQYRDLVWKRRTAWNDMDYKSYSELFALTYLERLIATLMIDNTEDQETSRREAERKMLLVLLDKEIEELERCIR